MVPSSAISAMVVSAASFFGVVLMASANSAGNSYVCKLTDFQLSPLEGEREWVAKLALQTTVAIDRHTGNVIHPVIGSTDFASIDLIHSGDKENGFKALARTPRETRGSFARYYEVREFVPGLRKPFIAVADGIAYTGYCE